MSAAENGGRRLVSNRMPPPRASRRLSYQRHLALVSAAAAILTAMAGLAFYEWRKYLGVREAGLHLIAVDDAVERLLTALIDAENGERGFLLSGDERYLQPYHAALKTAPAAVAELDRLVNQANGPAVSGLGGLNALVAARLENIRRSIEARRRRGAAGAADSGLSAEGVRLSGRVRTIAAAARAEVDARRREIQSQALAANRGSFLATSAGALLLAVLLAGGHLVLSRHMRAREKAMLDVHAAGDFLRAILASMGDAVLATDAGGRVEFANPVAAALLSLPQSEIAGQPVQHVFRLIDQDTREEIENPALRALREGAGAALNHQALLAAGGKEIPIDTRCAPITDEEGLVRGAVLIFRDVSASRRDEHSRELLAAIVQSSTDAIIAQDLDGRVTSWNRGAELMFGYSEAEVLGRPTTLIAVPGRNELPGILAHIRAGERIEPYQTVRRTRDGRILHVSITVSPVRDAAGRIAGASKIVRDITAQVEAAESLARSHAGIRAARDLLHITLASIGDAVVSTDAGGRVVFANAVAQSLLGLPEKDLAGRPLDEIFHIVNETTRAAVENPATKVLHEGKIVGLANHTVLLSHDGREIPIDDSSAPIYSEDGTLQGAVLVFRDITARRAQDNALRESEGRFRNMADSAPVLIWVSGLDRKGAWFNRPWLEFTGRTLEQELGDGWTDGVHPADRAGCLAVYHSAFDRREPFQREYRLRRGDGQWRWILDHGTPLLRGGDFAGYIGSCVDITERRQAEETLRDANAALARANEDLERFAFVASHDLQEPLRMITAYAQLLIQSYPGQFDPEASVYVENIVDGTRRMRDLLADLLAYTEIGAHPLSHSEITDLNRVVGSVIQNLKAHIEESAAAVTSGPLPAVRARESHMTSLFQNLISNAIKYRGDDPPRIHISVESDDGFHRFAVRDNGIGIDPVYHQRIFEVFKRLHGKKIPGTGVGLAICQRVVERYGGRIWVESRAGEGAVFYFTLPAAAARAAGEG